MAGLAAALYGVGGTDWAPHAAAATGALHAHCFGQFTDLARAGDAVKRQETATGKVAAGTIGY